MRAQRGGQGLEHFVEQFDDDRTRRRVADRREATDVGVPDHRAQGIDGTAHDRAGVNAPARILAEIGREQARGDDMRGMRLHCERQPRERRLQQRYVVVAVASLPVGRERIYDAGSLRAVAAGGLAIDEEIGDIVGSALAEELFEHPEITLFRPSLQTPAHRGIRLAVLGHQDQMIERTAAPVLSIETAVGVVLGLDRVEVAPPGIAVTVPLRMERLHCCVRAPQRKTVDNQTLAVSVEQMVGVGAAQSFAHRPHMSADDAMAEFTVERADPKPGDCFGGVVGGHGETFVPFARRATPESIRARQGLGPNVGMTKTSPG